MVKRGEVVKFFDKHGFINEGGANHDKFKHPDGRWTVIERHRELSNRKFELLKKQAGLKSSAPKGDEHDPRI